MSIQIIEYDDKFGLETVVMWRASMERALDMVDHHSLEEQLAYLRSLDEEFSVLLALNETTGEVVGMMAVGSTELDQLYVHVDYQGRGIGARLLDLAKARSPGKLQLYAFDINRPAQRFYEKHGFTIIARGIEEKSGRADIRYEWTDVTQS